MATLTELLQADWDRKETTDAIMAFRIALQNLKNTAAETKTTIDALVAGSSFTTVHVDLKAEGQACLSIVNQLNAALGNHADFIDFKPE